VEQADDGRVYPFGTAGVGSWSSGAGTAAACEGCGEPVPWRYLRWGPVERDGRVVVERLEPAWHPACGRRAAWQGLRADVATARDAVVLVGEGLARLVPPIVGAVGPVLEAGVPIVVERFGVVVATAREVGRVHLVQARRGLRWVRVDRVGRAAGRWVGGLVVRVDAARQEWARGVGYTRAWRRALDGDDEVGPVVAAPGWRGWDVLPGGERFRPLAPGEFERWGFRWDGRHASVIRRDPAAGEAGPASGAGVLDAFRRFDGIGPSGHGDVDTPSQQRRRRQGRRPGQE